MLPRHVRSKSKRRLPDRNRQPRTARAQQPALGLRLADLARTAARSARGHRARFPLSRGVSGRTLAFAVRSFGMGRQRFREASRDYTNIASFRSREPTRHCRAGRRSDYTFFAIPRGAPLVRNGRPVLRITSKIERRAAHHLKHFGRRSLLLKCLGKFLPWQRRLVGRLEDGGARCRFPRRIVSQQTHCHILSRLRADYLQAEPWSIAYPESPSRCWRRIPFTELCPVSS